MFIFIATVVLALYVVFGLGMLGMMKAASLSDAADEAMQAERRKLRRRSRLALPRSRNPRRSGRHPGF